MRVKYVAGSKGVLLQDTPWNVSVPLPDEKVTCGEIEYRVVEREWKVSSKETVVTVFLEAEG